ncbi:uncharacterized protein CCR75_005190 [Bremia lactucae]|uniref:N-terminal acetyltransferase B complex subunit NAA25 homolog n=1 Tax=Bremia lactucae TaxID=4779 RepID=A0A976FH31_BRELC|nr:hypothetical protein CCR75_005190 [Bremia lactucae]
MSDDARLMARYVRPIYEAIDTHQYRNAIKLCAHKRVTHLDIVQLLKAHSLERTGRVEEALEICRRIQLKKPTDEALLNTMNLVFKLSGCEHEMLPTFEYACVVSNPPNEELFQSLFMSYARCGAFLKQQQTALKMFKAFGNIRYMCWAALGMMLQVEHFGTPPRMLALAEKMLLKTLRESKSNDGEVLQLTVLTLQLQGSHQSALKAFDEFVSVNNDKNKNSTEKMVLRRAAEGEGAYDEEIELGPMQAIDRLSLEAALAKKAEKWTRCAAVNRLLLEEYNADDWTFLKEYLAARFQEKSCCSANELLALGQEVIVFFDNLTSRPGNERIRGPALARIHVRSEILSRLKIDDSAVVQVEEKLQEEIVAYADRFYAKTCCFTDLKQYYTLYLKEIKSVSARAKLKLIQHFVNLSVRSALLLQKKPKGDGVVEGARKDGQGNLSKRLLALKTLRFLGYYDLASIKSLDELVSELEDEYVALNWLNIGSAGGQREVQLTDDLLLLATHFLLDMYQLSSGDRTYLERAAGLLEYGLEQSAYNFQMKLLLSRVYGYMGAAEAMLNRHVELDIKYVQLDSLSFLVLDKMLDLCQYTEARQLTNRIVAMHQSTAKDTPEHITRAYRLGVYSKVVDMSSFLHKRMKKSHTLAISKGEMLRFELLDALTRGPSKIYELVTSSNFDAQVAGLENMLVHDGAELSFNQHREVIVDWTLQRRIPTGDLFAQDDAPLVECDRSANAKSSLLWLKLRVLVPKLLQTFAKDDFTVSHALKEEYYDIVVQLHLGNSTPDKPQLHEKLWKWSTDAIATSVCIVSGQSKEAEGTSDLSKAILQLQDDFTAILKEISAGVALKSTAPTSDTVAFSPYVISTLSSLLLDAGLSSLCMLALAQRTLTKKKVKKSEQVPASAMRNFFKTMQEALSNLMSHVAALQFTSHDTVDASSSPRDQAMRKAHLKRIKSYQSLQTRLIKLLGERCATIRNIVQK